jgi:UDP-3-O-[3-hydroxymyristoyl] glucosamine N-acyltransferase
LDVVLGLNSKGPIVSITVGQLAEWVRGEVLGDADLPISNARALTDAEPGDITFVDGDRHLGAWHNSKASAAVVPVSVAVNGRPIIRVADPLMAFARIVQNLRGRSVPDTHTVDAAASIHPSARLADGVTVGPYAVVGEGSEIGTNTFLHAGVVVGRGCRIGSECVLYPRAVLYDDCIIGNRVILHANSVIGADGFGYRFHNGRHEKVPQLGWVEIEDDVEIGAGATIDRGTFGPTRIGMGTKIDNLVVVAHNCRLGRHNIVAAQAGIAGSSTTGDYVIMGGQVGVADHVHIGDRAMLAAQCGVINSVEPDSRLMGFPARPEGNAKRCYVVFEHLPELRSDVKRIKKHLGLE